MFFFNRVLPQLAPKEVMYVKVLITSSGKELESQVSQRFDEGSYLLFVETVTMGCEAEPVEGHSDSDIVQVAIEKGVEAVITGSINDNAQEALTNAGIALIPECNGIVKDHLDSFIAHEYDQALKA